MERRGGRGVCKKKKEKHVKNLKAKRCSDDLEIRYTGTRTVHCLLCTGFVSVIYIVTVERYELRTF